MSADQLTYSLSASESLMFNYNGINGTSTATNLSGQAAYVSGSQYHPTSFIYSGGYIFGNQSNQPGGMFQNFGISQVVNARHVSFIAADMVSYLPAAPAFGLSGVPGVGDVGTPPIGMGDIPVQSIFTNYGSRVTNAISLGVSPKLTAATSLNLYGAYTIQRFLDVGQDNDDIEGSASLSHRMDARNTTGLGYTYSRFRYQDSPGSILLPGTGPASMNAQGVNLQYQHLFTRKLTFNIAAGPQWIDSGTQLAIPPRTTLFASTSLQYSGKLSSAMVSYSRGANPGSGVLLGTISDNVNFTGQHTFSRSWSGGFSVNYGHASSLGVAAGDHTGIDSFYAGVQATRRLGEHFSGYASYNLQRQAIGQAPLIATTSPLNAFNGTGHILGFGITFIPNPLHLRRH
ncbi:MAG: hypothetical protein JSS87_11640 [Acidobacteria bacterium]|nr:hypothetical protein [Acidobacteriota bacterium]